MQTFHMKAQRRILNIKWHDFVTNDTVRSQTKLTDLPLIIADRRHSLLGHVCRLPPDVPAHNILQHCVNLSQGRCPSCPDWKRPPGRPRKTWIGLQQMEEDHGCTIDSLWSSAQDRSLWRSLYGRRYSGAVSERKIIAGYEGTVINSIDIFAGALESPMKLLISHLTHCRRRVAVVTDSLTGHLAQYVAHLYGAD